MSTFYAIYRTLTILTWQVYSTLFLRGGGYMPLGKSRIIKAASLTLLFRCVLWIHVIMGADIKPLLLSLRCGSKELRDHHHFSLNIMKI